MNWLLYLGGGIIFISFVVKHVIGCKIEFKDNEIKGFMAWCITFGILISYASALLVWIWIRWKFI